MLCDNSADDLGGGVVVELEDAAESLPASDRSSSDRRDFGAMNWPSHPSEAKKSPLVADRNRSPCSPEYSHGTASGRVLAMDSLPTGGDALPDEPKRSTR